MAKALLELEKFSLLKWDRRAQTLLIHRLVQAVVKDEMSDTELTTFRSMVIDLCDVAFPDDWDSFEDRVACRDCVGQVMTPLLDVAVVRTETTAGVMFLIGRFLYGDGKSKDSEQLFSRGLEISNQIYGQYHPHTLKFMHNLALTYWGQGKMGEAATLQEEVSSEGETDIRRQSHGYIDKHEQSRVNKTPSREARRSGGPSRGGFAKE